jgi:CPA2 family monovalent cation:H+ antiporter-2
MVSHDTPFVATIVVSLALAYAGGIVARIAGLPNIVGYILAGIFVGPHTPGFTADQKLTTELAEIGVALLMFAIGLHFSPRDLLRVWHIAVPGALLQVSACTLIGFGAGRLLGWPLPASLVLGLRFRAPPSPSRRLRIAGSFPPMRGELPWAGSSFRIWW